MSPKTTLPGRENGFSTKSLYCTGNYKFQTEKVSNTQKIGKIEQEWQVTAEEDLKAAMT